VAVLTNRGATRAPTRKRPNQKPFITLVYVEAALDCESVDHPRETASRDDRITIRFAVASNTVATDLICGRNHRRAANER
jgi:hypothetical protein